MRILQEFISKVLDILNINSHFDVEMEKQLGFRNLFFSYLFSK